MRYSEIVSKKVLILKDIKLLLKCNHTKVWAQYRKLIQRDKLWFKCTNRIIDI
jgi:hypothetical protein